MSRRPETRNPPSLTAGAARVDITPPLTVPHLGFLPARHAFFEGVHDPLFARALVVGDGSERVALVSADAIGFSRALFGPGRDFIAEVRERAQKMTGIAGDHIMVAATHAHSTPETLAFRPLAQHPGCSAWVEVLADQLATSVALADRAREPVQMRVAQGSAEGIGWSRRIRRRDGSLTTFHRRGPDGEIADWGVNDPTVTVLAFSRLRGGPLEGPPREGPLDGPNGLPTAVRREAIRPCVRDAMGPDVRPGEARARHSAAPTAPREEAPHLALLHFACHPVTVQVNPLVSADFPGAATRRVESAGIGVQQCVFVQGAGGSINPVRDTSGFADVERYGEMLAGEAIRLLGLVTAPDHPTASPRVAAATVQVLVASRDLPEAGALRAERDRLVQEAAQAGTAAEADRARDQALMLEEQLARVEMGAGPAGGPFEAEVQALRMGEAAFVGLSAEPFAELGLEIRAAGGDLTALCAGYANGYLGYVGPPEAWEQGGYEVSLGAWSVLGPEAFAALRAAAAEAIEAVR